MHLDKGYATITFDDTEGHIDLKFLCANHDFKFTYVGELTDG